MDKSSAAKKTKSDRPFYEPSEKVPTSSKIINEARTSLRSVRTNRPFTPREENRTLFGTSSNRNKDARPPSAFSLGPHHFDGSDSRPVSGTRLSPIDHKKPVAAADVESLLLCPKPPVDPNRPVNVRKKARPTSLNQSHSIENLAEESPRKAESVVEQPDTERRVHSGPKERTKLLLDERGEGDGCENSSKPDKKRTESGYVSDSQNAASSRTSSATSVKASPVLEDETNPEQNVYFQQEIKPLLEEMMISKGDAEKLIGLANQLYQILESKNLLGRNCIRRSSILKHIFKLLDVPEPKLLILLAKIIFAFHVSGNNLTNVCKLVFKVSRDDKNDELFVEDKKLLDLLVTTVKKSDPSNTCDALVYSIGALKFLSGNSTILKTLAKLGTIEALSGILRSVNKSNSLSNHPSDQMGHVLVQMVACLRNLADTNSSREKFISCHIIEELLDVLDTYTHDSDIVLHISRIFSKLTLHADCCSIVTKCTTSYKTMMHVLTKHYKKEDVVVRLSFVLGNLTAKNDEARFALFHQPKMIESFLHVFKSYIDLDQKLSSVEFAASSDTDKKDLTKVEDVLMKLVRVLANLSINEKVGAALAMNPNCHQLLLYIIDNKDLTNSEELVLNTAAAINNLTYYMYADTENLGLQMNIAESMVKLVLNDHIEGMVEAARVFGNLSRLKPIRQFLTQHKIDRMLIALLDSGSRDVVYTACGVLINLMADEDKRPTLKEENGIAKLVEVLRDFGQNDWQLAGMVCQILWNYSSKIKSTNDCFGAKESMDMTEVLVEYLDEEVAFLNCNSEELNDEVMFEYLHDVWQTDFCPVANQLLQRIELNQSKFEELDGPS
ncbi:armadillo repeat-containing protein 2-like [Tubulanus polymorphus]|uniref:armadillo repeat-containing protein 2-like n=1 Tax=Tubulanus polymorphus TaxID=672921 RepID=UPI003DA20592